MRLKLIARIVLPVAIAVAALASAADSQAHLYCVNKSPCLLGTQVQNPQAGLTLAQLNPGPDTVSIGAQAAPYVGPFSYSGADPVTVVGAGTGPGETVLTAPGPDSTLTLGNQESVITNLRVEVVPGPNIGLQLEGTATGVRVQEVDVDGIGPATGVLLAGDAVFEDGTVVMQSGDGIGSVDPAKHAFVRDSTIRSVAGVGIWTVGKMSVQRSTVQSLGPGITVGGANGNADVGDTVVRAEIGPALRAASGATVAARHLTLLNDGSAERGIEVVAGAPGNAAATDLTLTSSIVSGFPVSLFRQGLEATKPGKATLRFSAWDGAFDQAGPGTIDTTTGNLPNTTPAFVRRVPVQLIEANLRLRAPSPLIDTADPGAPPVDHDGTPREQDGDGDGVGRSDIGAFEYVPHAPSAATIAPVPGATVGVPVQFAASGAADPDPGEGAQLLYSWDFGDGGTASGASPSHAFATAGVRTVTVTVTDPSRRSAAATSTVDVQAGPTPGSTPGPGTGPGSGATPGAKDGEAPRLSGVVISPRRLQLGKALPRLVKAARGTQIRFTLSEPATVTLRFAAMTRSGSKQRPLVLAVAGKAGLNRLRFGGRISTAQTLSLGRHRLTVTAIDAAGNRSPERIVRRLELLP